MKHKDLFNKLCEKTDSIKISSHKGRFEYWKAEDVLWIVHDYLESDEFKRAVRKDKLETILNSRLFVTFAGILFFFLLLGIFLYFPIVYLDLL